MKKLLLVLFISTILFGQSLNNKYSTVKIINGKAEKNGEFNLVEYIVKSNKGDELYRILDKIDYDIPYSKLEVFDNGSSVLISAFNGTLAFIGDNGDKIKSIKITPNITSMYERSIKSVTDGKTLIIVIPIDGEKRAKIQKYDSMGKLLSVFEIPFGNLNGVAYSSRLNKVFISYNQISDNGDISKKIAIFNSDGKKEKTIKGEFEKGFFSVDNKFIGFSNNYLLSIDANNLSINFKTTVPKNKLFLDVTLVHNSIITALADNPKLENGKWYYKNPTVTSFDFSGKILKKQNYTTNRFTDYNFSEEKGELYFSIGKVSMKIMKL